MQWGRQYSPGARCQTKRNNTHFSHCALRFSPSDILVCRYQSISHCVLKFLPSDLLVFRYQSISLYAEVFTFRCPSMSVSVHITLYAEVLSSDVLVCRYQSISHYTLRFLPSDVQVCRYQSISHCALRFLPSDVQVCRYQSISHCALRFSPSDVLVCRYQSISHCALRFSPSDVLVCRYQTISHCVEVFTFRCPGMSVSVHITLCAEVYTFRCPGMYLCIRPYHSVRWGFYYQTSRYALSVHHTGVLLEWKWIMTMKWIMKWIMTIFVSDNTNIHCSCCMDNTISVHWRCEPIGEHLIRWTIIVQKNTRIPCWLHTDYYSSYILHGNKKHCIQWWLVKRCMQYS